MLLVLPDPYVLLQWFVCIWIGFELLFYFVVMVDWKRNMDLLSPTPAYRMEPEVLIANVLTDVQTLQNYDVTAFLRGWFLGADLSDVKRGNVEEFLAWAMFNTKRQYMTTKQFAATGRVIADLTRRFGVTFEPGFNEEVKCSNFTLNPASVHVRHRPLLFYVFTGICKVIGHTLLFQAGFVPFKCGTISYWYRPCIGRPAGSPEPLPMVFFHGICPGLFTYIPMLRNLVVGRAALLIEMPHVGMGLNMTPPSRESLIKSVLRACKRHGVKKACVCGHSYGSFCAAWMVQSAPEVVGQLVLLDPMCLLLALPDVTYNFLYRKPENLMQQLINLGGASEMGVNHTLRRHFWWFNSVLFAHEIADIPTVVHVASDDSIAPSAHIREYLRAHYSDRLHETVLNVGERTQNQPKDQPPTSDSSMMNTSSSYKSSSSSSNKMPAASTESSENTSDTPPPPPPSSSTSSPPLSVSSSFSGKNKGSKCTLELIWSEGFSHGEIVLSTARQREIFKRMFIQECRIFAEDQGRGKSPRRHKAADYLDDEIPEEPVVRCC
jgi:pimeloyl-ACP methyl ester carboxylesterase